MRKKKEINPLYTTVVDPSEYDIEGQMVRMVKLANRDREGFVDMDVGKVWGLYLAWKELKEQVKHLETIANAKKW